MAIENLPQESLEDLALQMHAMHESFKTSEITVQQIFEIFDNFLSLLVSSSIDGKLENQNPFKLLECVRRLDTDTTVVLGRLVCTIQPSTIQEAFQEGQVVKLAYKLPVGGDYSFRIVSNPERTRARVEHGWDYGSSVSTGEWLDFDTMMLQITQLSNENWQLAQATLFPDHPANSVEMQNPVRAHWEVSDGFAYNPDLLPSLGKRSEIKLSDVLDTYSNSEMYVKVQIAKGKVTDAYWRKMLGPPILLHGGSSPHILQGSVTSVVDTHHDDREHGDPQLPLNDIIAAAVGFVFAGAGITYSQEEYSCNKTPVDGIKKLAAETASGGVSTGIGHGVSKAFSHTLGNSIIGMGSVVAFASLALSSAYDGIRFAKGKMTKIEYRKKTASNLGGAVGGLLGGLGTTLLVTFTVSNPVGWALALGAGAVGVVGGIAGAVGGSTIDKAIWDEGIDQVVHVYDFFGFKVTRDQQPLPVASPTSLIQKYMKRVQECHHPAAAKKKENLEWERKCQALFMLLLKFMFPVYRHLLELTEVWREKLEKVHPAERTIVQVFFDILES